MAPGHLRKLQLPKIKIRKGGLIEQSVPESLRRIIWYGEIMKYLIILPFIGLGNAIGADAESKPVWSSHEPIHLARYSLLSFSCTAFAYLIWQLVSRYNNHLRQLSTLGHDNQQYFVKPSNEVLSWLKEHLIYAPLFKVRHNREFRLSKNIHMGTLPSRFHSLLIFGMVSLNIGLCLVNVPHQNKDAAAKAIRKSTGTVATANFIPLVLMAGRNNPLIRALHVPFDTWMLMHRWLGRIVVIESLAHAMTWGISYAEAESWRTVGAALLGGSFLRDGFVVSRYLLTRILNDVLRIWDLGSLHSNSYSLALAIADSTCLL